MTRKSREAKVKIEAKAEDGMRAWAKSKARAKAEIARIDAKMSERDKIEAKVRKRERDDVANRKIEEAGARIRAS